MFAKQCRGEAFAITGMRVFMLNLANASPLLTPSYKELR